MIRHIVKTLALLSVLCCCLLLTGINVHAEPVQWEGNGHWYDAIGFNQNWHRARRNASTRIHLDLPGHLATLTSQAEQDFVWQSFYRCNYWLGGFQARWARTVDTGWKWITGEPWSFTKWEANKPDDCCGTGGIEDGEENFLLLTCEWWDDRYETYVATRYIVEYEEDVAQASALGKPTATSPKRTLTTRWADLKRTR